MSAPPTTSSDDGFETFAIVVIGKNEGERLKRCFESLGSSCCRTIYVDSGSTDDSATLARAYGCSVIQLDLTNAFSAARARNAGWRLAVDQNPAVEFVQFIDGDCQLNPEWIATAINFLRSHQTVAVVCGRRREIYPEQSIYNAMCDIEWNTPVGTAAACGGDAMIRVAALKTVDGFNDAVVAGEEPELCFRIRQAGWTVERLASEMTLHDAAIQQFGQWWKRTSRAGWAFLNGAVLHRASPQRYWIRESIRPWVWAFCLPILFVIASLVLRWWSLILLSLYPMVVFRTFQSATRRGAGARDAFAYGVLSVVGKFAELRGQLQWIIERLFGGVRSGINYKPLPANKSVA